MVVLIILSKYNIKWGSIVLFRTKLQIFWNYNLAYHSLTHSCSYIWSPSVFCTSYK